jgi:cytidylate kinase
MIIAIDGPSAAGKGTLAQGLAKALGYHFLDTGALYRMVGLALLTAGHKDADAQHAVSAARSLDPSLGYGSSLRTEEVAAMASKVAAIPGVRTALLDYQRNFARQKPGAVLDGRDIGTVVCPDADLKFFVTASTEVRARRRFNELKGQRKDVQYTDVYAEVVARDERDANRATAPTRPADDAILIDTSDLTREEALQAVLAVVQEHLQ